MLTSILKDQFVLVAQIVEAATLEFQHQAIIHPFHLISPN